MKFIGNIYLYIYIYIYYRVIESNKGVVINGKDAVDYYSLLLKEKEEQLVNIRNERDIIQGLKQF